MNQINFLPPSFYAEKARHQRLLRQAALLVVLALVLGLFFGADRGQNHGLEQAVESAEADALAAADLVKKIAQLLEQVRHRYGLHTGLLDEVFVRSLASHSGTDPRDVRDLVRRITEARAATHLVAPELLRLSQTIDAFQTQINT